MGAHYYCDVRGDVGYTGGGGGGGGGGYGYLHGHGGEMGHGADRGLVLVNVFEGALCSLSYVSVESAAQAVLRLGRGALLAKVDIRSAYRNIPVHPDDRWLLGLYWDGATYIYTVLPFRLRSAPKIFNSVVDALEWVVCDGGLQLS